VVALLSFGAVALLLDRAAGRIEGGGSGPARARVALLWTLNPLILFELVNAAHVDGLAVALGLLALLAARQSAVGAGLAAAAAAGVKLTLGLYALSVAWALRRQRSRLAVYLTTGAVTGLAMYLPFWPGFLRPLQAASDYVSSGSVWHPVGVVLGYVAGPTTTRVVTSVGAVVLLVAVVRRLDLGLPPARGDDATSRAVRTSALLGAGWLLTATYALPWYDAIAWVPLLLLPASGVDVVLLARMATLALAYLPGVGTLPGTAGELRSVLHGIVAPTVSVALVVVVMVAGSRLRLPPPADTAIGSD
jgi:hypothetical protein